MVREVVRGVVRIGLRAEQLSDIVFALDEGRGRGLLITGAAGVGKTHLASCALDRLTELGYPVKRLSAIEADDVPLGSLSRALSPDEAYSGLTPIVSLRRFLDAQRRPTVFLLDDVDRLDTPSVAALVEATTTGAARLVATIRADIAVPSALERGLVDGTIERLDCPPFERHETTALAEQVAGGALTPSAAATVHDLTQGNALYIRELVRAAQESGALRATAHGLVFDELPVANGRLIDLLEHRISNLGTEERDALYRIALIGDVGHHEITKFVDETTLEQLDALGLVGTKLDGRRLRFEVAHPLHAEIVRSTESPLRKRRVLAEHAAHIESYGMRRGGDKLRLATWSLDGICEAGPDILAEGARLAESGGDHVMAQRLSQAAFDAEPTLLAAQLLATRQLATGDFDALRDHFPRWAELAATPSERATYEELYTQAWFWRGHDESMIGRLLDGLDSWPDHATRSQLQAAAAALLVSSGRIDEAVDLALAIGDLPPGPTAVLTRMTLGHGWRAQAKPVAAASLVAETLEFYRSISADAYLLSAVALAGLHIQTLADAGRFAEIDEIVAARFESWRDLGDTSNLALANLAHGHAWLLRGDYDRARRLAAESIAGFERNRHPGMRRWGMTLAALAAAESGDLDDARRLLGELDAQRDHPAKIFAASLARARSWLAYHDGRGADAARHLIEATTHAEANGDVAGALDCLYDLARQGRPGDAERRLGELLLDEVEGHLHAHRIAHVRAAAAGDIAGLRACMAAFDSMGATHLAAECAQTAAAHASTGPETRRWLQESARRRRSGATALAQLLTARSATQREREVAMLAAKGLSSREISERLGISHRTVETHLGNVYAKLGIDSRLALIDLTATPTDAHSERP